MAKNFSIDRRGIRGLMVSPEVGDVCMDVAKVAQGIAEGSSPNETGEYRGSFDVQAITEKVGGANRAGALLSNDSDHAAAVEFGNRRVAGQHVLSRAIEGL